MARIIEAAVDLLARNQVVLSTTYGRPKQKKEHVIVRVKDENGRCGYGEATPLSKFTGETAEVVKTILEHELLPLIIGLDSSEISTAHVKMDAQIFGNQAAKCAIDCAMYDLLSKTLEIPLAELLGGCFRNVVPINRHIGIVPFDEARQLAEQYRQEGFYSIKMKVGLDVEEDFQRIQLVREVLGSKARIRVDGNNGMDWKNACALIEATRDFHLEFYEQLVPKWDLKGMRELRLKYGVPVLADEAVSSIQDAVKYAEAGATDAFVIKLVKCGGLYPALGIAMVANAYKLPVVVTSTYDTQIGCSACLALACALPNASTACDLTVFAGMPDFAETAHELVGMDLHYGKAPGIGVFSMVDYEMK